MSDTLSQVSGLHRPDADRAPAGSERPILGLAEEVPVAFRYNDFPYAVMMATPADLEDFALGFSLTEGLIAHRADIRRLTIGDSADGMTADIELAPAALRRFLAARRRRQLHGFTGCGVCGIEDLKDLHRESRRVAPSAPLNAETIRRAVSRIREFQPLSCGTRAAHASVWVDRSGVIETVREDVGRHNSLDKLIGAGLRGAFTCDAGFCLITSRCSFEMAQKAIAAGFPALVALSAPTALAVRTAEAAGLALYARSADRGFYQYAGHAFSGDVS